MASEQGPRVHDLKIWPRFFAAVTSGKKPFELRRNDRDYRVGDVLHLHEFNVRLSKYTGAQAVAQVSYIVRVADWFPGTDPEAVVLGLGPVIVLAPHERSPAPALTEPVEDKASGSARFVDDSNEGQR